MHSGSLASYYDRLGRWTRLARVFGFGGGSTTLTVHRALADPSAGGQPTFTRLHDLLVQHVDVRDAPRVLDAGCGLGGTMLMLADALQATCVGLTLSPSQAATANDAAARVGLQGRVRAEVRSYDQPPAEPFDLIVAIESLAHSPSPQVSVAALARVLAPGGCVAIVDDMPEPSAAGTDDLALFRDGWQCPVLWSADAYIGAFHELGLDLVVDKDLSGECRPRSLSRIDQLLRVNRLTHRVFGGTALGQVMDSHLGGLALERMIRRGFVRYRMLIARKPILQVS